MVVDLSGMGRALEEPSIVEPYALVCGPPMSRRSLRPQLNQIRGWVRQGPTDAWIAHKRKVTVQQTQPLKRERAPDPDTEENGAAVEGVDLRAEDDAQIAAELEAEAARRAEEEARAAEEAARRAEEEQAAAAAAAAAAAESGEAGEDDGKPKRAPRRRGGRSR